MLKYRFQALLSARAELESRDKKATTIRVALLVVIFSARVETAREVVAVLSVRDHTKVETAEVEITLRETISSVDNRGSNALKSRSHRMPTLLRLSA